MTKDLELTLAELGPEYRDVVARLQAPFAPRPQRRILPYLLAASVTLALALSALLIRRPQPEVRFTVYTAAYAEDEAALHSILASQRSDGSWSNDYLTMQNAAALRRSRDEASRIAYKRAVRYLRQKGLAPISDNELKLRSRSYFNPDRLPNSTDILI